MHAHHQPERIDQPSRVRSGTRRGGEARHTVRSAETVLALQRTAGNAAVASLLDDRASTAVHEVLRSPGSPLDAPVRQEMEARLGADFSDVRVHTGPVAQRSAAGVAARAYTSGSHVVLGAAGADRRTLAHELTHVIQQRSGSVSGTDTGTGLRISDPTDRHERAAESNAARVMAGSPPVDRSEVDHVAARPAGGVLQRASFSHGVEQSGVAMTPEQWMKSRLNTFASAMYDIGSKSMIEFPMVKSTSPEHAEDILIRTIRDNLTMFSPHGRNILYVVISKSPCTSTARGELPRTSKKGVGCTEELIKLVNEGVPGPNGVTYTFKLNIFCRGLYAPSREGFTQGQVLQASETALDAMRATGHITVQTDVRPGPHERRFEASAPATAHDTEPAPQHTATSS